MLVRNETDSRIVPYITTAVSVTATQITPVNHLGLPQAAVYIANMLNTGVHYDIKGCYSPSVSSTAYWYSIASGTVTASIIKFIGAHDISGLADNHAALTVEYFASAAGATGNFVLQLQVW